MVIFNLDEKVSNFAIENKIIEINTKEESLIDFIKKVEAKDPEVLAEASISVMRFVPEENATPAVFTPLTPDNPVTKEIKTGSYNKVYSDHDLDGRIIQGQKYRPQPFIEYENTVFNQNTKYVFTPDEEFDVNSEEFLQELYCAAGIMPTLWKKDMPLEEKIRLSKIGKNLYRWFDPVGYDNPLPTLKRIEHFEALNDYEKRIINNGRIHPKFFLDVSIGLKYEKNAKGEQVTTQYLLTKELLDKMLEVNEHNIQIETQIQEQNLTGDAAKALKDQKQEYFSATDLVDSLKNGFANKYPEMLAKAKTAFEAEYKGHAPMVLNWYMQGQLEFKGIDPDKLTDEQLDDIVKSFKKKQKNVSQVAKYRNPTLFALDGLLTYGNLKQQLIEYIGVNISVKQAAELNKKGFFEWLSKYSDTPISVIDELVRMSSIQKYELDLDAAHTLAKAKNARGYEICKNIEKKYGYKFEDNITAIKGRHTVVKAGDLTMRFLDPDDYTNFTVGEDTHCCMVYYPSYSIANSYGENCVYKMTSDPFSADVVIERKGELVGQAFVFTNEATSTFVFDNFEFANSDDGTEKAKKLMPLIDTFVNALPYQNVHIGMGYNALPGGIGIPITKADMVPMVTTIDGRHCYSDYHDYNARVVKKDGVLTGAESVLAGAKVTTKPDEKTEWDELASPQFAFLLNAYDKPKEERIRIAKEFMENPDEKAQMDMVRMYPEAVLSLDNPCHEAQMYLLNNPGTKKMIGRIKNPCIEIQMELFNQDPNYIRVAKDLPDEVKIRAVQQNGLLLEAIENPSDEVIKEAVRQNGYAIRFVPKERITNEIALLTVTTSPKAISLLEGYSDEVLRKAVEANPDIITIAPTDNKEELRAETIERKPSVALHMDNLSEDEARLAVERNGLLIRNFQKQYPELREVAIYSNPWAIGVLKNPTFDEAMLAVSINPAVECRIHDDELLDQIHLSRALAAREEGGENAGGSNFLEVPTE